MSKGGIAGIVVGGAFGILLIVLILYVVFYRRKKVADQVTLLPVPGASELDQSSQLQHGIPLFYTFISFFFKSWKALLMGEDHCSIPRC